ncbi:hypothetical protein MBRA1_000537 [Malassezia brasiliensis]|uniref:Mitochondrial fission process protein 1 n=1 Tax=Malassezia brasiliensis TaxID=1821822 RepID=A0AAF0DSF2_9BASI|nr:hypothetical protein MBRA1_000537 [Malassezia brasiliensis]
MSHIEQEIESHHTYSAQDDEGFGRYSAYAMRLRKLLTTSSRAAYAVSWAYIFTDVGYTCYKSSEGRDMSTRQAKEDISWIASRRFTFQLLSSVVKYSAPVFARSRFPRVRSVGPTVAGLLTVPLLPMLFDEPVEVGVDHAFDLLELKVQAYYGNREAQQVLDEKMARLKSKLGFDGSSKPNLPAAAPEMAKSPVDAIGTTPPPDLSSKSTTAAQLAVLGVGVDLLYLPRMRSLVSRHAQRLCSSPWHGAFSQAPRIAMPQRQDGQPTTESALAQAAHHFARRTLSKSESAVWGDVAPGMTHEDRLRFLATR